MLNPQELAQTIDAYMAANCGKSRILDVDRIAEGILVSLEPSDRNGIDREVLRLRVMARGCTHPAMRW